MLVGIHIIQEQFFELPQPRQHNFPIQRLAIYPRLHFRHDVIDTKSEDLIQGGLGRTLPEGMHAKGRMRVARPAVRRPGLDGYHERFAVPEHEIAVLVRLLVKVRLTGHRDNAYAEV